MCGTLMCHEEDSALGVPFGGERRKRKTRDYSGRVALEPHLAKGVLTVEAVILECTPKMRPQIKGPATLNGGELCWCPDNSIPVN